MSNSITDLVEKPLVTMPSLIPLKDVIHYTGLSRSTIYELINEKSERFDPTFPKKVQVTQIRIAWVATEVADWIESKIKNRH